MKNRTSFVLLSTLWGTLLYFTVSLALAFLLVKSSNNHPHSMAGVLYIVLPAIFTPIGLLLGLVFGLVEQQNRMKKVLFNLGISIAAVTLLSIFLGMIFI